LLQLRDAPLDVVATRDKVAELVHFVLALTMGTFYANKLQSLLSEPPNPRVWTENTPDSEIREHARLGEIQFRSKLLANRDAATSLVVELLRYQNWSKS
jgi:hypothetical protein